MKQEEIDLFKSKLEMYEGRQTGSQGNALLTTIISSNIQYLDESSKIVKVIFDKKDNS